MRDLQVVNKKKRKTKVKEGQTQDGCFDFATLQKLSIFMNE